MCIFEIYTTTWGDIINFFNQLTMNFLKTFFNNKPKRASQKESEIQKRKEKLLLNTSNPTPLISEPNRKKSQPFILKK